MDKELNNFYQQYESEPLAKGEYLIEKFEGKGGWTFIRLPHLPLHPHNPFGWVRVKGKIDAYELKGLHLMPMGNGSLFLSLKKEVRKAIGKKEGDTACIILYSDNYPTTPTKELEICLAENPKAAKVFYQQSKEVQIQQLKWIYEAKTDVLKESRIVEWLDKLEL